MALKIYFAGTLFDHKDLLGNLLVADAVEKLSGRRYEVILPQENESNSCRNLDDIRNSDLEMLLECDLIVANFDGQELDSGTVVEFMFAKMLDYPALLLRTDFRNSGDSEFPDSDPWNLMCSGYPRSRSKILHAMRLYHQSKDSVSKSSTVNAICRSIAGEIIAACDELTAEKSWIKPDELPAVYTHVCRAAGESFAGLFPAERISQIVRRKISSGIY